MSTMMTRSRQRSQVKLSAFLSIGYGFVLFFMVGFLSSPAAAQSGNLPSDGAKPFASYAYLSSREAIVSFAVLGFGVLMTIIASALLRFSSTSADNVIRLIALVVIVTGTLFLVASGYSAQDIAPAMGLLGTIGGYLLGRNEGALEKRKAESIDGKEKTI